MNSRKMLYKSFKFLNLLNPQNGYIKIDHGVMNRSVSPNLLPREGEGAAFPMLKSYIYIAGMPSSSFFEVQAKVLEVLKNVLQAYYHQICL